MLPSHTSDLFFGNEYRWFSI